LSKGASAAAFDVQVVFSVCQVVANQDTASRQLGAMRAEIIALQQELMMYRMVYLLAATAAYLQRVPKMLAYFCFAVFFLQT